MDLPTKKYLGDGVYVDFDGWNLVLTAENGVTATDRIVLEPEVIDALSKYAAVVAEYIRGA